MKPHPKEVKEVQSLYGDNLKPHPPTMSIQFNLQTALSTPDLHEQPACELECGQIDY